jgi:hypothetical protein
MSTATLNSKFNAFSGTYGSSSLTPSISLLGFVASEISKFLRQPSKAAAHKTLTVAQQAEALRRYADEQNDPRFADDLYAAAARHEELV